MNDDLQQKYNHLMTEYVNLMDENRNLKGKQNAKQTSEYNSLVREYCKLQEENKNLKQENFTLLNGRGYLKMNETKDDLKIQVKVILVFIVLCLLGMVLGTYIFDATTYTFTGIIIFCFFLWSFIGCARVANKIVKQLQDKE